MNLNTIAKATIAATAITVCSLGNEMPAKAYPQKICWIQDSPMAMGASCRMKLINGQTVYICCEY
jgi:hypothetical protein